MTLSWQISIIDGLIRENEETTVGDYLKMMARMGPRERKVSGPLKRLIWADLYNPGYRRWPPAMLYTYKSYRCTFEEASMWWQRDKKFEALENLRLPRKHFGKKKKRTQKIAA